jgi:hypothetical protein
MSRVLRGIGRWWRVWLTLLVLAAYASGCGLVCLRISDRIEGWDRARHRAFRSLKVGMLFAEVVRVMGTPKEQSTDFHLGQHEGFEAEYERASRSGAAYYLFWENGIDYVYAVGFDAQDRLILIASGGT